MLPPDKDVQLAKSSPAFGGSGFGWCSRREDKAGQAVIPLARDLQFKSRAAEVSCASPPSPAKEQEGASLAIKYERSLLRVRVLEQERETMRAELAKTSEAAETMRAELATTIEAAEKLRVDNHDLRDRVDQCSVFEAAASTARSERGEALQRAACAEQRLVETELRLEAAVQQALQRAASAEQRLVETGLRFHAMVQERDNQQLDSQNLASRHEALRLSSSVQAREFEEVAARLGAECDEARSQLERQAGADKKAAVQLQQANAKIKALQASLEAERMQEKKSENCNGLKIFAGVSEKFEKATASWTDWADIAEVNSQDPTFTIDDEDLPLSQILVGVSEKLEAATASWTPWADIEDVKWKVDSLREAISLAEDASDFGAS